MFAGGVDSYEQNIADLFDNIISIEQYNKQVSNLFTDLNTLSRYQKTLTATVTLETYSSMLNGVRAISSRYGISEHVIPSCENFSNVLIKDAVVYTAVEDFKEMSKDIIKKIVEFIKMIISKLRVLFDNLFGFSNKTIVRANKIKRQLQDLNDSPKNKIIKNAALASKIKIADKSDVAIYAKTITKVMSLPASTSKVFDIVDAASDTKLIESCGKMLIAVTTWLQSVGLTETDGDIVSGDVALMPGHYTFKASLNKKTLLKNNTINLENISTAIGGIKYFLASVSVKSNDTDVQVLTKNEMSKLADLLIALATEYKNSKQKNDHLMQVLDTFVKRLETTQDKEVYGVCKLIPALISKIINTNTRAMSIVCKSGIEYLENSVKQY